MKIVRQYFLRKPIRQGLGRLFKLRSKKSGFSFMEVMIVVAIVGIMTAVGLVSMSNSRNKKALEVEARKVVASIRQAQNYALTGKMVSSGYPCRFTWTTLMQEDSNNETDYQIRAFAKDSGDGSCPWLSIPDVYPYSLQNGVVFVNSGIFHFWLPFGTGSFDNVILKKGSLCVNITINSVGVVTESYINCP